MRRRMKLKIQRCPRNRLPLQGLMGITCGLTFNRKEAAILKTNTLTQEQINAMRDVDVRTVDPDTLRDIREVKVNAELPKRERILDFIRQIGNPYCYRHGKYVVKISYTGTEVTLEDRLLSYIRSKC